MKKQYYIVDSDVLPDIYRRVVEAKELVENKTAKNISEAIKMCDISRSAFYKYKDSVFKAKANDPDKVEIQAVLLDRAGVLSEVSNVLFKSGANVITVNQTEPKSGLATISFVIGSEGLRISLDELVKNIESLDGVISVGTF